MTDSELLHSIYEAGFSGFDVSPVSGGDINTAYRLKKGTQQFFLKANASEKYPEMLKREAEALQYLAQRSSFRVPEIVSHYSGESVQWLLLEWVERGIADRYYWQSAGEKLAAMHLVSDDAFGWHTSNYIGSLLQMNSYSNSWHEFYAYNRLLPLTKRLEQSGQFSEKDRKDMEKLCEKLPEIFPEEKPALLHGVLWSGNMMPAESGAPCIYDPAIYFGHREMDIGMTLLFGGFPDKFYYAYESIYPLEKQWQQRTELTQLYPLLVHAVLFGGSYVSSVKTIVKRYLG